MAAWRNGNASDYEESISRSILSNQEIAGSTPAVVIFVVQLLLHAQIYHAEVSRMCAQ